MTQQDESDGTPEIEKKLRPLEDFSRQYNNDAYKRVWVALYGDTIALAAASNTLQQVMEETGDGSSSAGLYRSVLDSTGKAKTKFSEDFTQSLQNMLPFLDDVPRNPVRRDRAELAQILLQLVDYMSDEYGAILPEKFYPLLMRVAAAYEAATGHRSPPPDFGPLAGEP